MNAIVQTQTDTVFHAGELALQQHTGMRERVEAISRRLIRDHMPEQHRELFEKLPTLIVGSFDVQRRPWASLLAGRPGFMRAPDARHLRVRAWPADGDPLQDNLALGAPLGLLGIEPQSRRRNRMNGTVVETTAEDFVVEVDQSFGNCAQYIQARHPSFMDTVEPAGAVEYRYGPLSNHARALVERADTLFIASATANARGHAGAEGVDVSHRGGRPGFVRVNNAAGTSVLTVPDFRGNSLFNTLGNIATHPHAGLLFVDYANGDLLQLSGAAHIVWDGPEVAAFAGAQRLLRVTVELSRLRRRALPLRWTMPEPAPQLADTGSWRD